MVKKLFVVVLLISAIGCDGPSKEDCRKAFIKIRGLEGLSTNRDKESEIDTHVRKCISTVSKESVACVLDPAKKTSESIATCPGFGAANEK